MTRIIGTDIQYTLGDTFKITVSGASAFNTGDQLKLQVKTSEEAVSKVVDKTFALSDGKFNVVLSDTDVASLELGEYVYRMTYYRQDGTIITTTSGRLCVVWGC